MSSSTPPVNDLQDALDKAELDDYATIKLTLAQLARLGYKEVVLNDDLSNLNEVSDYLEAVVNGHPSAQS